MAEKMDAMRRMFDVNQQSSHISCCFCTSRSQQLRRKYIFVVCYVTTLPRKHKSFLFKSGS